MWTLIMIIICVVIGAAYRSLTKKKEGTKKEQTVAVSYTPTEVFEALGVEIVEKKEDGDYVVAYQGGYFLFSFVKDSKWVDIYFLNCYTK